MAEKKRKEISRERALSDLGIVMDGATLEMFAALYDEPDAEWSPGELARGARGLRAVADAMERSAKNAVKPAIQHGRGIEGTHEDCGVEFKYVPASSSRRLNARLLEDYLESRYGEPVAISADDIPEVYVVSPRVEHIKLSFLE